MIPSSDFFRLTAVETSRDQRGWVSNLLDFLPLPAEALRNVHLVEMQPGSVRGNHVHKKQREWIILCGGPLRVVVTVGDDRFETVLAGDAPMMLHIEPGAAHAVRNEGAARAFLVAITDQLYDFENPDVQRVRLLD
ncbi:MAG: cupin domain-containing protein [Candidatus Lernaella stagnicola]|nr:cupin domain-containing protein [Candidatus Lernaella stagnicola]